MSRDLYLLVFILYAMCMSYEEEEACMSRDLYLRLSVCLSVCPSLCLSTYLSLCLSVGLSRSMYLPVVNSGAIFLFFE